MGQPQHVAATRAAYDTVAADYAELLRNELEHKPFDRATLAAFFDLVRRVGDGPIVDVGCGPGRVTAHLHGLGAQVSGIDLSPAMIAEACAAHPELRFAVGSITALDLADATLAGIVAWYSIIHTPPDEQPAVFAELNRVLVPGGHLLLAFQSGDDERVHLDHAYGHPLSLDVHRLCPDRVAEQLADAGFDVTAPLIREPADGEKTPQAYVFAQRATAS